ncbi:MAG: ABC transporter permease [Clostridia bacterium]|nr:ABC transporter permease [Clostridia bacterium]
MLKFAFKNMAVRKSRLLLVLLSIVISAGVALLSYNVAQQVNEGIVSTAAYYDMIVGPSGSATQLAMNTMFFTDKPLGTIPYSYVEELQKSGLVNQVVPFTMGDSYNNARIVGTTPVFLEGKPLAQGDMFAEVYEAVVGAEVARIYGLKVGDQIVTSHGLNTGGAEHAASPLTVVGILKTTGTAYDNTVFTSYKTVWAVHEHHDDGDEDEDHDHEDHEVEDEDHDHEDEEGHEGHAHEGEVCAILVKTKGFNEYYKLNDYYGQNSQLLCINPSTVLREVLDQVDLSARIVYLLCGIILIMNIMVISVITLLNLFDARKEIALMRLIGISMKRIAQLYLIQNSLIGLIAIALAMLLSHGCLGLMSSFVASMGIVLNSWTIYPLEWAIAALVFVISVLPTMISILHMSRQESL